jgi:hypothetical protein
MSESKTFNAMSSLEQEQIAMALMSDSLLRALWREHPRILREAALAGRKVEKV